MLQYDEKGNLIGLDTASLSQPTGLPRNNLPAEPALGTSLGFSFADMPVAQEPEEDNGILDYITDFGKGIYNGVVNTVQETAQFGYDVADLAFDFENEKMPGYEFLDSIKADTKTAVGGVTESITNIGLGLVGAGKFLKAAKLLQGGGKAAMVGRGLTQGAMADAVVIDPLEGRLSNLVESVPALSNPITRALAAEPDDTRWEGRFKNAVEGLAIGVPVEFLFSAVKGLRAIRHGDEKALDEVLPVIESYVGKTGEGAEAAVKAAPDAAPQATLKATADSITAEATPEVLGSKYYKALKENSQTPLELRLNKQEVVNPARFSFATEEGYRVHQTISEMTYKDTILGKEGAKSWDEIAGEGLSKLEDIGFNTVNVKETLAKMTGNREVMEQAAKDAFVLQDMMVALTREYEMLGSALERGSLTSEAATQYARKFQAIEDALVESHVVMRDHGTTVGRSLGVLRKISQSTDIRVDVGSLQKRLKTHKFSENAGKPQTLVRYAAKSRAKGFMEYGTEMFINNILSSPITHSVNITSNALKVTMTPLYRALGHLRHAEFSQLKEDAQMVSHLFSSVVPSAKYAIKALKEDRTVLEGIQGLGWTEGLKSTRIEKAWSKDNVLHRYYQKQLKKGASPEQLMDNIPAHVQISANVAEALGKAINLPTRFLKMEDEFFKQLTYRSELKTNLTAEALEKMPRANSKEIAEYITRREASFFDEVGGGLDNALLQKARENTFTQDLTGELGKSFQRLSNAHPVTKMVIPFVRTPTNLLMEAQAHVPLVANFTKRYKDAVAQGGRTAREAEGKVMLGGILAASTSVMAYQGLITGSAPEDPKLRQALERTGWKPHSIKIGDSYFSFNRLDPLAVLLSATANLVEAAPHLSDGEYKEFASTLLTANIQLLADKSYMQSLGSLMDALSGDEREAASIIQNIATGMIPYSSLLGAVRTTTDEIQRDVRSVESRIMNRIPGFSSELPAKFDWLTGKPVSQTFGFISPLNEDTVARELAVLGGVIKAPGYKLNNVELTEAQHSRYCELIGTVQLGGKNLHQALNSAIRSPAYDLQRSRNVDVDGGRSAQLHKIIDRYRKAAQQQFARENLEFTQEKFDLKREKKAMKISNGSTRLGVQEPRRHSAQERNLTELREFIK